MATKIQEIMNNISDMSDGELFDLATRLVETLRNRQEGDTPKRGRKAIYTTDEERRRVREAVRKARIHDRNKALAQAGLPIPKRGRPKTSTAVAK